MEALFLHRFDVARSVDVKDPDTGAVNTIPTRLYTNIPGRLVVNSVSALGGRGAGVSTGLSERPKAGTAAIVTYEPYLMAPWDADVIMGDHITVRILDEAGNLLQTITAIAGTPAARISHKRITLTDIERA